MYSDGSRRRPNRYWLLFHWLLACVRVQSNVPTKENKECSSNCGHRTANDELCKSEMEMVDDDERRTVREYRKFFSLNKI